MLEPALGEIRAVCFVGATGGIRELCRQTGQTDQPFRFAWPCPQSLASQETSQSWENWDSLSPYWSLREWPWVRCFISLSLSLHICRIRLVPHVWGMGDDPGMMSVIVQYLAGNRMAVFSCCRSCRLEGQAFRVPWGSSEAGTSSSVAPRVSRQGTGPRSIQVRRTAQRNVTDTQQLQHPPPPVWVLSLPHGFFVSTLPTGAPQIPSLPPESLPWGVANSPLDFKWLKGNSWKC